jgi:catechol 2,3-dioxygenase-like lactoylglutathione lyase family enzyme
VKRVVLLIVAAAAVAGAAHAANAGASDRPAAENPLAAARPCLMSISVANLDASVRWYGDVLGFREVKRLDLPASSLRISFLEHNGFRLEMIEFKHSVSLEAIRSKFPGVDDRAKVQGFGKLAFAVPKIGEVAAALKAKKVKFVRDVTREKDTGETWFIVEDVDGNWVQFFEAEKAGP